MYYALPFQIDDDIVADLDHAIDFYQKDKTDDLRMAPKLRQWHVNPSLSQRMKVRYATQLLSRTVSAGIRTMAQDGRLPLQAMHTSDFFRKANDCFDLLNSSTPNTFSHKQAISRSNYQQKFKEIDEYTEWITKWTFQNDKVTKSSMPFQQGLLMTLRGVKEIIKRCFEMNFRFVPTRRLNQDCLEVRVKSV